LETRKGKPFVTVSGLPGSGKTTLARRLAPAIGLPLIDKDDILDRLFELKGVGDSEWRRTLSRESDRVLQQEALLSTGAVLVSFWHLPGMPSDSGTPVDWLSAPSHRLVNVHCVCSREIAAERFSQRRRHPGHLDDARSHADLVANLETLARLPPLDLGRRIEVDTTCEWVLDDVVRKVLESLGNLIDSSQGQL
jgi:hypothetical protein